MRTATATTPGTLDIAVGSGPAVPYEGLRRALAALAQNGADFTQIRKERRPEWRVLFPTGETGAPELAEIALAPSERRLHRESEQAFRVLCTAARALCLGSRQLDTTVVLRDLGRTDLPSLRGFMRAVEHARVTPGARLVAAPTDTLSAGPADVPGERLGYLRRIGLTPTAPAVDPTVPGPAGRTPYATLFAAATSTEADLADRLAATLGYARLAFFAANWEGMAIVASAALPLLAELPERAVATVAAAVPQEVTQADAIEFEPTQLRSVADIRAYLCKVLGIQATYRGDHAAAVAHFRAMSGGDDRLSAELRAQGHMYAALTLSKRLRRVDEAIGELEQGFAAVAPRAGEPASIRRERGWLHNLRALTHFSRRELRPALDQEKAALACIEGLHDASSVHLRINLLSNLSVLQESAGKTAEAATTWARFQRAAGSTNSSFLKHHAYRAAGLALRTGQTEVALGQLERAVGCAVEVTDDFHEYEIRVETGALLLRQGQREAAAEQFHGAHRAADRLGDPYRLALAMVGERAVGAGGEGDIAELAGRTLVFRRSAGELAARLADPGTDLATLLPLPRTKLNRPFDLINQEEA